jgi:hypothetical protein
MKTYWEVEVQLHSFLTLAQDGGERSASCSGRFTTGESPRHPIYRRLGGPQSRSRRGCEEKNSQPLSALEPTIIQSVAQHYTTELWALQSEFPKFDTNHHH